jgi:hypothetical protein
VHLQVAVGYLDREAALNDRNGRRAIFRMLDSPGVVELLLALYESSGTVTMGQLAAVRRGLPVLRHLAAAGLVSTHSSLDNEVDPAMPVSLTEAGHELTRTMFCRDEWPEHHPVPTDNRPRWLYQLRARLARLGRR